MCQCNKPIPYTNKELKNQVIAAVIIVAILFSIHFDWNSVPHWIWQ